MPNLPADRPAVVYRAYDGQGRLVYVGCTTNLPRRLTEHKMDRRWWTPELRIEHARYNRLDDALRAEAEAINTEHPAANILPGGNWADRAAKAAELRNDGLTWAAIARQLGMTTSAAHTLSRKLRAQGLVTSDRQRGRDG